MKCNRCGQPLEEWEVGRCERCGLSDEHNTQKEATTMGLKTQYRVFSTQAWQGLTEWTDSEAEANQWLAECESHETEPECRIQKRENISGEVTHDELVSFAESNQSEFAWRLLAPGQFSCDGWYLEVDADCKLTGNVIEANERGFAVCDDESLGCVCKA